jgi:hypothetical protein
MTIEHKLTKFLEDAPLFFQPWWLEMVSSGAWDYAVARRGDEVAAVLPFVSKHRLGWRLLEMPRMTPYLGPWLRTSTAKYAHRLSEEKDLLGELIDRLPAFAIFHQSFHPSVTNWLPFFWKDFQQTTRYTYRFADTSDLEKLWSETRDNVRTDVKKAGKQVEVEESDDFEQVIRMQKLTLGRQNVTLSLSDEFLRAFGTTCAAHNASKVLLARDAGGRVHACVYLLWDKQTVYYYTGGGDPELRKSGAASLLVWKAIEFASAQGKRFDFEGSMNESIERFFRSFGAVQAPYFVITKTNSFLALAAKRTLGWWKG